MGALHVGDRPLEHAATPCWAASVYLGERSKGTASNSMRCVGRDGAARLDICELLAKALPPPRPVQEQSQYYQVAWQAHSPAAAALFAVATRPSKRLQWRLVARDGRLLHKAVFRSFESDGRGAAGQAARALGQLQSLLAGAPLGCSMQLRTEGLLSLVAASMSGLAKAAVAELGKAGTHIGACHRDPLACSEAAEWPSSADVHGARESAGVWSMPRLLPADAAMGIARPLDRLFSAPMLYQCFTMGNA